MPGVTYGAGTYGSGTYGGGPSVATVTVTATRDRPPDDVALYVESADGSERRIAGDERSLPLGAFSKASTLPGGDSTLDGEVVLPPLTEPEFDQGAAVSAKLSDRTEVWGGRIEAPIERSDERALGLSCVGHQAALVDASSVIFLGVWSDLTGWEEPPTSRRTDGAGTGNSVNGAFSMSADEDGLTITMEPDRNVESSARGEAWFRAPGNERIAEVQYIASDALGTNMDPEVRVYDDPADPSLDAQNITADLALHRWTPSTPGQYARWGDSPTAQVNKAARILVAHAISLFGDHDLPRIEIDGGDLPDGLRFSDILEHLVSIHAPVLETSRGGESTIVPSPFTLPFAAWLEPLGLDQIIEDGIQYEPGREWAVWGRCLHYGPREDMGRTWVARRRDGARFIDSGETASPKHNGVVVTYTDHDGRVKTVGPPSANVDHVDASLADTDPDNPINASSVIADRPLLIDVGDSKRDRAIELGQMALADATRRRFTGEVELGRYAEVDGQVLPTVLINAGDRIVDGDSHHREELPLVSASYARGDERPFQGTIDTPSNRLDAALARHEIRPRRIPRSKIRRRYRRQRRKRQRQHRRERRESRQGRG